MIFKSYDIVEVISLVTPNRGFTGTEGIMRPPRIGDIGTICHEYFHENSSTPLCVEMIDENGYTIWLADFNPSELSLVSKHAS